MDSLGRKFYILSGLVFMAVSIGFFALSAMFYLDPVQGANFERAKSSAVSACASSFNGSRTYMGMSTEVVGNKVYFRADGLDEWEGKFNMASHVVSSCEGMTLKKFCFGESCDIAKLTNDPSRPHSHTGMFFELEFDVANIDPRISRDDSWKN